MEIFCFTMNVGVLSVDFAQVAQGVGELGGLQENIGTEFDIFSMDLGTSEPEPKPPR